MKYIENDSVDLIFTDPPYYQYRAQNVTGLKNHKDVITKFEFDGFNSDGEYLQFIEDVLKECYRVTKVGGSGYMFCADDFVSYINKTIEKAGFSVRKVIHWHKTNPFPAISTRKMYANSMELIIHFSKGSPKTWNHKNVNDMHNYINTGITKKDIDDLIKKYNKNEKIEDLLKILKDANSNKYLDNLIENPICMGKERTEHRTQKPLKVCIPFIEISSNEGDLILDPFMGSGSTAIAALKTDRNFIGYEIDKDYCDIIQKRFDDFMVHSMFFTGPTPSIQY